MGGGGVREVNHSHTLKTRATLLSSFFPKSSSLGPLLRSPTYLLRWHCSPPSVLGYLSWNLETLEQHSQEFIKVPPGAPNLEPNPG